MNELNPSGNTTTTGDTKVLMYERHQAKAHQRKVIELPTYTDELLCDIVKNYKDKALNYKKLLGNLIAEGDLTIFFGYTNTGKSLFAYQLADAIASGLNFFDMMDNSIIENYNNGEKQCYKLINTMPKQKVLYVDFEMSKPQLALRYFGYEPSRNITLLKFNSRAIKDKMGYVKAIEEKIIKSGIKVIFIDNMTNISMKGEEADFASDLINNLADLRDKYNLTIILIAHTFKVDPLAVKTLNMLKGSSSYAILVDSVFCISETTNNNKSLRYLKQFKCRFGDKDFEENRVIEIELIFNSNGNKGFIFNGYERETKELKPVNIDKEEELINAVQDQFYKNNISGREIAKRLFSVYGANSKNEESFIRQCQRIILTIKKESEIKVETPPVVTPEVITPEVLPQVAKMPVLLLKVVTPEVITPVAKTYNSPFVEALMKEQQDKENYENAKDLQELLAAEKNNLNTNTTAQ